MNIKQVVGIILIIIAIVIFFFSYNTYITNYHKTVSTYNFTFLFSGIFWDLVGIIIGAIFFGIGLILTYPKGVRWLVSRGK